MAKRILKSYESLPTHFFGDSWEFPYLLTMEVTYKWFFFWERKRIETTTYIVSMFQSLKQHHEHWDKMIETQQLIKK